jgi:hypothetical protein
LRNTGPASLDAFVERECDCSSTGAPRAARRRCNCRRPERGALAARHGRTCTRSPCRGCPCCGDALDGSPCLRYRPCQAAGKGSAYAACCAHDSSCVRIRIRTQSACPMLILTVGHTVGSYDITIHRLYLCEADNMLVDDMALELWLPAASSTRLYGAQLQNLTTCGRARGHNHK